jgi:S1-C subfamily serine protease
VQTNAGSGRISAVDREVEAPGGYLIDHVLETDAVIEPGTSGGPLLGSDGRVLGITSRMPGEDSGTGFAVPANTVREVVSKIEDSGKVVRPYIGLRGSPSGAGIQVTAVADGGPAARAGIQTGDTIDTVDGQRVTTLSGLFGEVDRHAPGDTLELGVARNGGHGDVQVTLLERPATMAAG